MLKKSQDFDWSHARAFLATADAGTFSGGARALGLTQPTLSRQVAALEADLGVTLFERVGNGLQLTETGLGLLDHVRAMSDGADRLALTASGQAHDISGDLTLTATDIVAGYLLPPALRRIQEAAPGLRIDILASNNVQDLRRREADISIRHVRPSDPELIGKYLMDAQAHLYASEQLMDDLGRPVLPKVLKEAPFLSYGSDTIEEIRAGLLGQGLDISPDQFRLGCGSGITTWQLVQQGMGISMMMEDVAERTSGIERVLPDWPALTFPVWLVAHREVHTSRRVRLVFDILAETFQELRRGKKSEKA